MFSSKKITIFSWALYDFANSVYGMNVMALHFALWLAVVKGVSDIVYGFTLGVSMFLAAAAMPVLGAVADRSKSRMPYLVFFTLLCVVFLALLGLTDNVVLALVFFTVSNIGYLISGAVFYNTLLPYVAGARQTGSVSSYGVSLSYFGTIAGLLFVRPIALSFGHRATFAPTALFFLLFALPCFFFVKDKTKAQKTKPGELMKEAFAGLKEALKEIKCSSGLFNFFLAVFIIINVLNAVFVFMSVYLKKVFGFFDSEIYGLYIFSNIFSVIGALISGVVSDKIGAKKTLTAAALLCGLAIFLAAASFSKYLFWIIGPMVGVAISAVRVSGRAFAVEIFSREKIGKAFGLLGLLSNLSFAGFLVWGITVYAFSPLGNTSYRLALLVLLALLLFGVKILQKATRIKRYEVSPL